MQGNKLFIHGGFEPEYISQPLETMTYVDMSILTEKMNLTPETQFAKTSPNILNTPNLANIREKDTREIKEIRNERN